MKTLNSLLAISLITLTITSSTVVLANNPDQSDKSKNVETVSASKVSIASIKRIVVTGDVEVTLSQSPKSKVLYTNDGANAINLRKIGNVLYIDGKGSQGAKVTVYVDDIYRIDAAQNAVVHSNNTLHLKYLQVYLKDNAYLDLNAKTESLLTVMENASQLNLKGTTDFHTVTMDKTSRIMVDGFKSKETDRRSDVYVASRK